jgi:hypothetical protein
MLLCVCRCQDFVDSALAGLVDDSVAMLLGRAYGRDTNFRFPTFMGTNINTNTNTKINNNAQSATNLNPSYIDHE